MLIFHELNKPMRNYFEQIHLVLNKHQTRCFPSEMSRPILG